MFDQANFPQSRKFSTKNLIKKIFNKKNRLKKFSAAKKILHKKFDQGNFPQSRKFSTTKFSTQKLIKKIFHNQENFPQKGSLKPKILDPFNTKFHTKIFLAL